MAKTATMTIMTTKAGVQKMFDRWMEGDCQADLCVGKGTDGCREVKISYDKTQIGATRELLLAVKGEIIEIK